MTISAVPPSLHDVCRRLSCDDHDLLVLDLAGLSIGNNGAIALGCSLQANTQLQSLSLSYNLISPMGAVPLLKGIANVKALDLRYNSIGKDGAQALASILHTNTKLQKLSIRNNYIGPNGATHLAKALEANTCVEKLDLGTNSIGNVGAEAIAKLLQTNQTLRCLCLGSNDLDAEGIRHIAQGLRYNTTLEVLNLGGNEIGDEGAKELAEMLRHNTTLQTLHVANSQIGRKGTLGLARVLTENTTLQVLDILHNPIGFEGAAALCGVLRIHNRTIKELRLDYQFPTRSVEKYCCKDVNAEIALYLKLNQSGRAQMTNIRLPWGSWSTILAKVNGDADLMYLTLQEKPELLQRS